MIIFKRLLLGFVSLLFITLLFATAFDIGFVRIANRPENVKKLIADSGAYETVVPIILTDYKKIDSLNNSVPTDDPLVKEAINKAIPPSYIKQKAEYNIDAIYAWLDGKSSNPKKPDILVELWPIKSRIADNISTAVYQRLIKLPTCTFAQSRDLYNDGLDWRTLPCTYMYPPYDINPGNIAGGVKDSIISSNFITSNTSSSVITADSFKSNNDNNKSIFEDQLKNAPEQYQKAKKLPLVLSILTIITAAGVVFLSVNWQKGLKHAGIILVVVGVVMMLFAWSSNREVNKQLVPNIKADNLLLQKDLRNLATELTQQISKNYWFFGGLYTVAGVGSIAAAEMFMRRAHPESKIAEASQTPAPAKTPPKPKPSKKS